ncbi:Hypothetical_protein [Hexamita inflata]|uniref:Hypothetical_protein n=1 Tax=Hexamita inflata TaxID=28002 RepID=A0AA86PW69_9EUKA|nr:Hypothetical protein HINF_LOCUS29857 [Hexamita inflata]CAI9942214.1 Hypothetical protein HINF_LOCUS29859 [Hexamita inflata]
MDARSSDIRRRPASLAGTDSMAHLSRKLSPLSNASCELGPAPCLLAFDFQNWLSSLVMWRSFQPRHVGIDGEPDFCFRKSAMLNIVTQWGTHSSMFFGTEIEFGLQNGRSHRIQNCDVGSCFWRRLHHIPISQEKGMIQ